MRRNFIDERNEKCLDSATSKVVPEEEYKKTFDKLLERMELCINNYENYFEHLIKQNSNFLLFFLDCKTFGQI